MLINRSIHNSNRYREQYSRIYWHRKFLLHNRMIQVRRKIPSRPLWRRGHSFIQHYLLHDKSTVQSHAHNIWSRPSHQAKQKRYKVSCSMAEKTVFTCLIAATKDLSWNKKKKKRLQWLKMVDGRQDEWTRANRISFCSVCDIEEW